MYNNPNGKYKTTPLTIPEDLSKRIISLRFILIVFVVFIHNQPSQLNFSAGTEIYAIPIYVNIIRKLISNIIARVAVPLFFLISGYLLYAKEKKFVTVIKTRARTILLPYMLWNILAVLFFYVAQSFSFAKPYFATAIIRNFDAMDWLGAFTGKSGLFAATGNPLAFQFWFLRDLFILNIFFVGIKKLVDIFPFGTLVLLFTLWIRSINIYIVSPDALLFFALGYYIVKYSLDYKKLDCIRTYDVILIYIITIIAGLTFGEMEPLTHKINIVIGSVLFIKLTYHFINNKKLYNLLAQLEKYAFFVYASLGIVLAAMQKLSAKIIPMRGGWLLLQYFGVNIVGIAILVMIGMIFRKILPKPYAILTGGRI